MKCIDDSQLLMLLQGRLPAAEIEHFEPHLDRCPDCQALLADLAQADETDSRGRQPRRATPASADASAPEATSEEVIGRRYLVLGKIGQGGMGQVFRVLDRLTGQTLALKRMSLRPAAPSRTLSSIATHVGCSADSLSLQGQRLALAREFRTLASLRHPNIISVFDYGFDERRQPYFTMELLEGARPLSPQSHSGSRQDRVELLIQILRALSYLHRRGILHRDLKPSNILVQEHASHRTVKVLDFGLALVRDEAQAGQAAGTLRYMAPELFLGEPASEASDLYAVGILAYTMLAGRTPFHAEGRPARLAQLLPVTPDLSLLPAPMRTLIGRALDRSPANRPADAASFAEELRIVAGLDPLRETEAVRDSFLIAAQFTGRQEDLRRLRQLLMAAKQGRGATVLVGGEAGVGKSRLLEELRSRALTDGVLVIRGQARTDSHAAYHLWLDVLQTLALHVPLTDLEARVLTTLIPELPKVLDREILPPPELDAQGTRLRLLRVLREVIERAPAPTLLLLEDLQWSDDESLTLLKQISDGGRSLPLLLVGSFRSEEAPDLPLRLTAAETLQLARLSRAEMEQLCRSMLGPAGQTPKLVDLIEKETEGNTFFVIEVVRSLAESSGSLDHIGQSELPGSISTDGMTRLLARRLGRVPAEARTFLRLAAVAGRQLDVTLLARSGADLGSFLHLGEEIGVLEVQAQRWRFSHDKLREQILGGLQGAERSELHTRVAQLLEACYAGSALPAGQVAHHYHQAGERTLATRYYALAGLMALARGAPAEASATLELALKLQEALDVPAIERIRVWRGLAQARYGLGRLRGADVALQQVCALAGDPLPTGFFNYARSLGNNLIELAQSYLTDKLLLRGPPQQQTTQAMLRPEYRAEVFQALSIHEIYFWLGKPERMLLTTLRGMNLAEALNAGSQRLVFRAGGALLLSFTRLGKLGLRYLEATEAVGKGGAAWTIVVLRVRSTVSLHQGRWQESAADAEQAVALARAERDDLSLMYSLVQLQLALVELTEFKQVITVCEEIEELALRAQNSLYLILAMLGRGGALLLFGDLEGAEECFRRAREAGTSELGPVPEAALLGLSAMCARHQGQMARARQFADGALDAVRRGRWPMLQLRYALIGILEVYFDESNTSLPAQTDEVLSKLRWVALQFPFMWPADQLYRALYHLRKGKVLRAWLNLRQSLRTARRYDIKFEQGWAHYWMGRIAQRPTGRRLVREGAEVHFSAAERLFTGLGASWELAYIRERRG